MGNDEIWSHFCTKIIFGIIIIIIVVVVVVVAQFI
jgi:hypothetical protein